MKLKNPRHDSRKHINGEEVMPPQHCDAPIYRGVHRQSQSHTVVFYDNGDNIYNKDNYFRCGQGCSCLGCREIIIPMRTDYYDSAFARARPDGAEGTQPRAERA